MGESLPQVKDLSSSCNKYSTSNIVDVTIIYSLCLALPGV